MKEIRKIEPNIWQYVFVEGENNPDIEVNLTALLNGDKAFLIDTGFPLHANQVKEDLLMRGIEVEKVILSHYHPDHAAGVSEFDNAQLSCSVHYKENYKKCSEVWDSKHNYKHPDKVINNNETWKYGDFVLTFIEAPGHSKCSLITLINDRFAHVGDLVMSNDEDKPIIPYISEDGDFNEHVCSLEKIRALDIDSLILSHGKSICGKKDIEREINKREHYLKSVIESDGKADIETTLIGGSASWSYTIWHSKNLKSLM
ncbi:MAG: hypothetical protein C0597_12540 [Marinilabiliales bacterium]|nr:MAG: hypothetical protein C0597_12540 [Marinilabiliales bacterium]